MYGPCQSGGGWILGHLIDGTQAELARIPFADNSLYKVPEGLSDEQVLFLVDTRSTPTLLRLVSEGRLDPQPFATHRFTLDQIIDAYGVFADAAKTNALKMVLTRS
jgi:threonine dehydrogenase-like Zn-dependent dehydrogenase